MRLELPSGTPAEAAKPSTGDTSQGLVIAPDIGGLRPLFDDLAARLAEEQHWNVVAVEPWPGREHLDLSTRLNSVSTLRDRDVLADLVAAADVTGADRVGIIGFCMGGMYAMKASATGRFTGAVSFYGMIRMPEHWRGPEQSDAIDAVAAPGAAPVLAICGGRDPWLPADRVDELSEVAEVHRYPEAEHGFVHDPDREAHRPEDARDAWSHALRFLGGDPGAAS